MTYNPSGFIRSSDGAIVVASKALVQQWIQNGPPAGITAIGGVVSPAIAVTGIALSPNTGTANSAGGSVIGQFTATTNTGAALINPIYAFVDSAGGDFQVISSQYAGFLPNNVPAGGYNPTVRVTADNLSAPSQAFTVPITITTATATPAVGHRYWRVNITRNSLIGGDPNGEYATLAEIAMAISAGGANVLTGGTPSASSAAADFTGPEKALDGDLTTRWQGLINLPQQWAYDLGSGVTQNIAELRIGASSNDSDLAKAAPTAFTLEWSDDGSTWVVRQSYTTTTYTLGSTQTFAVPSSDQPIYRLALDSISDRQAGSTYTETGKYFVNTPSALDFSVDGGNTWTAVTNLVTANGGFSCSVTYSSAAQYGVAKLMVRDQTTTSVVCMSNLFSVNLAPNSDGYGPGIYYPSDVYIGNTANAYMPISSGFARFSSNLPQTWSITGADAAAFVLGGANGSQLSVPGSGAAYSNTSRSTFNITVNVTDGTTTYSQPVTVHNGAQAAYFGTNFILDTALNKGNGNNDPQACQADTIFNSGGGSVSFSDSAGKLTAAPYLQQYCTTSAVEPVPQHYGKITTGVLTIGSINFPVPVWLAQEQLPYASFQPATSTLYSFLGAGDLLGQIVAYSDVGITPSGKSIQLISSSDNSIAVGSTGLVYAIAPQTAGNKSMVVQITSNSGKTTRRTIPYTIAAGTLLAASNLSLPVSTSLDNYQFGQAIGTAAVSGMSGTIAWAISNPDDCVGIYNGGAPLNLFTISGTGMTAAVSGTAGMQIPATSPNNFPNGRAIPRPAHQITITATSGSVRCRQTFSVPVAWRAGPTLYVGQGMASAHGSAGYEHWSALYTALNASGGKDIGSALAGALIKVAYNSDPNYYANDGTHENFDSSSRFGSHGPFYMQGVPGSGGQRPRMGGTAGSTAGGAGADAKAYLLVNSGDVVIDGFEFSYVQQSDGRPDGDTTHGVSNVRKDADVWGDFYMFNCAGHDGNNIVETGNGPYWAVFDKIYFFNFGTATVSAGQTHGIYAGASTLLQVTNSVIFKGVAGHCIKSRARKHIITGTTLADGERGTGGNQLDIPECGDATIDNCVLQKGANPQNPYIIQYGEEQYLDATSQLYKRNRLNITNTVFACMSPNGFHAGENAVCVSAAGINSAQDSSDAGAVTLINNSFYFTQNGQKTTAPNQYGFAKMTFSEVGSTMLTTLPTINLTDPAAGTFAAPARPSWFLSSHYLSGDDFQNFAEVQIDPGSDVPLTVSHTATAGTLITTMSAYGSPQYANDSSTDPRINPFASGAAWSIVQDAQWTGTVPWAAPGRYTIGASNAALTMAGTPPALGVTDFIKVRCTSSDGNTKADWRFSITGV